MVQEKFATNHPTYQEEKHKSCEAKLGLLDAIQFDLLIQSKKTLPLEFMKLRMDVPLAGTVQELQSHPIVHIDPGGIPTMTHKASLKRAGDCFRLKF